MTEDTSLNMVGILFGRLFSFRKPAFRYQEDYDNALYVLNEASWYFLYHALEGPHADQVSVALNKCMEAFEARQEIDNKLDAYKRLIGFKHNPCSIVPQEQVEHMELLYQQSLSAKEIEHDLRYDLNVLVYGKRCADDGECGYDTE